MVFRTQSGEGIPCGNLSSAVSRKNISGLSRCGVSVAIFLIILLPHVVVTNYISMKNFTAQKKTTMVATSQIGDQKKFQSNNSALNELALHAQSGDRNALDVLMHKLSKCFRKLAKVYCGYSSSLEPEDLVQEGLKACCEALGKYRPECGNFLSYAWTVARSAIIDALVKYCGNGMSKHLTLDCYKVERAASGFFATYGYEPSDEELVEFGGLSVEMVEFARYHKLKFVALDEMNDRGNDESREDYLDYKHQQVEFRLCEAQKEYEASQMMEELAPTLLDTLSEVDRRIVVMSVMGDCTLEEIKEATAYDVDVPHSLEGLRKRNKVILEKLNEKFQHEMDNVA